MTTARPLSRDVALRVVDRDCFRNRVQVDASTGCWNWVGAQRNGYGLTDHGGVQYYVHRVYWVAYREEIDVDIEMDHLCRNRRCLNPDHLEPTTRRINTLRGESFAAVNAEKTHCPAGHPLEGENVRVTESGRSCWTCNRQKGRERYRLVVAAASALGITTSAYRKKHGTSSRLARAILESKGTVT